METPKKGTPNFGKPPYRVPLVMETTAQPAGGQSETWGFAGNKGPYCIRIILPCSLLITSKKDQGEEKGQNGAAEGKADGEVA